LQEKEQQVMNFLKLPITLLVTCLLVGVLWSISTYVSTENDCYNLAITGKAPVFLFSECNPTMPKAHSFHSITIIEYGDTKFAGLHNNSTASLAWQISSKTQKKKLMHELKYGEVPADWKQTRAPKPLTYGQYYKFNNEFYFRKTLQNTFVILSTKQYIQLAQSKKLYSFKLEQREVTAPPNLDHRR